MFGMVDDGSVSLTILRHDKGESEVEERIEECCGVRGGGWRGGGAVRMPGSRGEPPSLYRLPLTYGKGSDAVD